VDLRHRRLGLRQVELVRDVLYAGMRRRLDCTPATVGKHKSITGLKDLETLVEVDQTRSPHAAFHPASYVGFFNEIASSTR